MASLACPALYSGPREISRLPRGVISPRTAPLWRGKNKHPRGGKFRMQPRTLNENNMIF